MSGLGELDLSTRAECVARDFLNRESEANRIYLTDRRTREVYVYDLTAILSRIIPRPELEREIEAMMRLSRWAEDGAVPSVGAVWVAITHLTEPR
jgi:hypothetical protein